MVVVMAIIATIAGISYPAISAGMESIRLSTAADSVASFLNAAMNRCERRQEAIELIISAPDRALSVYADGYERKLVLPDGISLEAVLGVAADNRGGPQRFILLPGGTPPRAAVQLVNRKGARRIVRVDPMTGIPRIEVPEAK